MKSNKVRLGSLIEQTSTKNVDDFYGADLVVGMTINRELIPTKANVVGTDLSSFLIVEPYSFVMNPRTHGKKIGLAFNNSPNFYLISWNNLTFRIKDKTKLLPTYLFMFFNREEWDREATFSSWGSSTEVFSFNTLCDMTIEIPSLEIQRKYVAIYECLLANIHSYERGLDDLKLVCDGLIENLKRKSKTEEIGKYIHLIDERNKNNKSNNVKSVSITKYFNDVGGKVNKQELQNYKIVKPRAISYVQTTGNEKCFAFAINDTNENILVTSVNNVFETSEELDPFYLGLWFRRKEFDRYARFISWGSAREVVSWEDLCNVRIPIPDLNVQKLIVDIFSSYKNRLDFVTSLKTIISGVCPVLIRGSIEESMGGSL